MATVVRSRLRGLRLARLATVLGLAVAAILAAVGSVGAGCTFNDGGGRPGDSDGVANAWWPASTARYTDVAVGWPAACGITEDLRVECWRDCNRWLMPEEKECDVGPPDEIEASVVSVGVWHACAIDKGGEILCWLVAVWAWDMSTPPPRALSPA